jgi:hypothetical protein
MLIPLPIKIAVLAFVTVGAFAYGFKIGTAKGEAEIQRAANEAQELAIALEKEQQMVREVVRVEYVDRVTRIKEKETIIKEAAEKQVPGQFDLSNGWVHVHNAAASEEIELDMSLAKDPTSSLIRDNVALQTVNENYAACLKNAGQLELLQKYIVDVNKKIDEENQKRGINIKLPEMPWKK